MQSGATQVSIGCFEQLASMMVREFLSDHDPAVSWTVERVMKTGNVEW